ncbi:S41 family peptidase [Anaerobranca gottschalkii]|uniref:Peptidase family S41 n=1 Tax=Anaerobranca gottschalkii DSM 13577 TaxID=1120990 RepID=A0A1I0C4D7_9FIRM|nr:S41 family peptidase [Anaerobranca gottschalkii]SET14318.1 Peptidase family S41 [Anaerobranca gottschalkii DSM 13577]
MKRKFLVSLLALLLAITLLGCNNENTEYTDNLTTEEKLEDFEYLYQMIYENYPFLNPDYGYGTQWLNNKEVFKKQIKETKNDEEFIMAIRKIVESLHQGHTHALDEQSFKMAYSVYSCPEIAELTKPWLEVLNDDKVLKFYNFNPETDITARQIYQSHSPVFESKIIIPNEVAYLKIRKMETGRIEEDAKGIRTFFEEVKDYDKLIIDIRGNGGGDTRYWIENVVQPLIREPLSVEYYSFFRGNYAKPFYKARGMKLKPLSELEDYMIERIPEEIKTDFDYFNNSKFTIEPLDPVGFEGDIYLLVDKLVYSAAESFAAFSKDSGFATLVGESTGRDGIGIDPLLFSLPNSGIVIRYSGALALNGDGTIHQKVGIVPHVEVDPTVGADFETDTAIQYVINKGSSH